MGTFYVNNKTGFVGDNPEIYDKRGIFYNFSGNEIKFNLPKGEYSSKGEIYMLDNAVKFRLPKLPPRQRKHKMFFPFIELENNLRENFGTVALIYPEKGKIIFDEKEYFELLTPEISAIYFHECGHFWYSTEKFCDIFAAREMIKNGYNPSQCGYAFVNMLNNDNIKRKYNIVNKLENVK